MSILNYIETIKQENEGPRITIQEPRNMAQAPLANELAPGAVSDELLKGFDPSQETHEEYLQRINLERPFNAAQGGRIGFNDGRSVTDPDRIKALNEETVRLTKGRFKTYDSLPKERSLRMSIAKSATARQKGTPIGKGSPGVPKPVGPGTARPDFVSPMKDPKALAKRIETNKNLFQKTEFGKRLQWIADNGKNFDTPEAFKKAYEKHWGHKIGSKKDALFSFHEGAQGIIKDKPNMKKINYRLVDGMTNPSDVKQPLSMIKKGFSEDELFKGSILQNNSKVKEQFKVLFKDIHNNVSLYSELGPEGIVERLRSKGGGLLKAFDFIDPTKTGTVDIGGVHTGITRNSLLALGVEPKHLVSYQSVRKPLMALSHIIDNLKNPSFAKGFGISSTTATKIRGQLKNFVKGEGDLSADIRKINATLGDKTFNKVFGGVNFEHTLAKQFGKDYKYLPRNYLLKGQFTTKAFNMMKRDAFDLPLIQLMKGYEKGTVSGEKIQNFINDFNKKTNNYADFSFDVDKGRFSYGDNKVSYDLSRYKNPDVARQELIRNIKMTMSPEFQQGMKSTVGTGSQLKLFKSKEAKNLLGMLENLGCPKGGKASGGRVGFQGGTNCAGKGKELLNQVIKSENIEGLGDKEQKLVRQILNQGKGFLKGTGRFALGMLNPKSFMNARALLGPEAAAFLAVWEGAVITNDVLRHNLPLGQALAKNWMTGWAKENTLLEEQIEDMRKNNFITTPGSERAAQSIGLMDDVNRAYSDLNKIIGVAAINPFSSDVKEAISRKEAEIKKLEDKYEDFISSEEGMDEDQFEKDLNEYEAHQSAGYHVSGEIVEDLIGYSIKDQPGVKVNEYGYRKVAPFDAPELEPRAIKKGIGRGRGVVELDWTTPSYKTMKETPLSKEYMDEEQERIRKLGYIHPVGGELPQWYKDKLQTEFRLQQAFHQSQPGLRGTQFAGGGMVGIRRPSALPPTGGPMSQGLRSLYINDRDY